jgi:trehalose-6-phosphate synthase
MISGTDPRLNAITGVPHAIASIITSPNGSGQSIGNSRPRQPLRNADLSGSPISPINSTWRPSDRGPRAGGLAVALADALRPRSLWFGWSGKRGVRPTHAPTIGEAHGVTYATIDLGETEYRQFYAGFSNAVLWPLLHYRLGLVAYSSEQYDGYRAVNRRFAAGLAPLLQDDDLIWVHDYQLIPLGEELRALGIRNRIGFHTDLARLPHITAVHRLTVGELRYDG